MIWLRKCCAAEAAHDPELAENASHVVVKLEYFLC